MKKTPLIALLPAAALLAGAASTLAAPVQRPEIEFNTTSAAAGLTTNQGTGVVHLPNLGTDCKYNLEINAVGVGIKIGVAKVSAKGWVKNLFKVQDIEGGFIQNTAAATLVKGAGVMNMRNETNNVVMELKTKTEGLNLGVGGESVRIKLKDPVPNAANRTVVYFDTNKAVLDAAAKSLLENFVTGWKCRYGVVDVEGHTDTVGETDINLRLSQERADAVANYLLTAGFNTSRINARGVGKAKLLKPTGKGVAARSNRAVVLTVK